MSRGYVVFFLTLAVVIFAASLLLAASTASGWVTLVVLGGIMFGLWLICVTLTEGGVLRR